jgi:YHS domain-containing protein
VEKMAERVKDLACGMEFDEDTASGSLEYYDKIYYFCSVKCKEKFAREPDKYTAHEERE